MRFSQHVFVASLLSLFGLAASAAPADYGVRTFDFEAAFAPGLPPPDPSPTMFLDDFSNGDPLTGAQMTLDGGVTVTPASYSVLNRGFAPGSETNPTDWAGITYGLGRLTLTAASAQDVGPNNLTPPGLTNYVNRLTLADTGSGPLLRSTSSFEVRSYWDYVTPDAAIPGAVTFYGLRLSDNPGSGGAYNDVLDLAVLVSSDGRPKLWFRRLAFDGVTLTNTNYAMFDLADSLAGVGKNLGDAAYVGFQFHYNYFGPGDSDNGVLAAFEVVDAAGSGLLNIHVPRIDSLFDGEDFTRPSVGATWQLAPVPEPGAWALLLLGIAAVGAASRRRGR